MKYSSVLLLAAVLVVMTSCNTAKTVTTQAPQPIMEVPIAVEERQLDTLTVTPEDWSLMDTEASDSVAETGDFELPLYNASNRRENDLIHTRLEVKFNWEKEQVMGKATLRLKPYFYPVSSVTLDAKNFEFHKITMAGQTQALNYTAENGQVIIQLGKTYTRYEEYSLYIEYTATPAQSGGSEAITSDKGLFFINPRGEEGEKPRQIWTQGETENNSRWFPTIDKPNERGTQEIYITVEDKYKTLSNGLLISSKKNADGTRTDYWKMDQPHAPYLWMLAVGEYAVVKDKWEGLDVDYYVEPKFEKDARAIFPYTPNMLSFFSKKLGVKYPWPKFAQVVVRDYVSGAMENTTAVVFGEFMQRPARELIDELTNEKIVAHEMFHQWFGDLVTCESWANLTLNEGFANYSEYLWLEHKHGRDAADYHLLEESNGYFGAAQSGIHPLIHYGYEDKEAMFDAHSYNKGGSVLHMLRNYVGDEAFFLALSNYLQAHKYNSAEVHDLRLAFEGITGEDLNWFFNQWYLKEGHPQISLSYGYDAEAGEATLTLSQTQDPEMMPAVFELKAPVDIYVGEGKPQRQQIHVTQREQTFRFKVAEAPKLMVFDPEHMLLSERSEARSEEQSVFQFMHAPRFIDRFEALQALAESDSEAARSVFKAALRDTFWVIRAIGLENLAESDIDAEMTSLLRQQAAKDPHSYVRATAFSKLAEIADTESVAIAKTTIGKEQSFGVIANALRLLNQLDNESALVYAQQLEKENNADVLEVIGDIYIASGDAKYLAFFENKIKDADGPAAFSLFSGYASLVMNGDEAALKNATGKFQLIATDMTTTPWRRVAATRGLVEMRGALLQKNNAEVDETIKELLTQQIDALQRALESIKSAETDPDIRSIYDQLIR